MGSSEMMEDIEQGSSPPTTPPSAPLLPISVQHTTLAPPDNAAQAVGSGSIRVEIEQDRPTNSSSSEISRSWGWRFKNWWWTVVYKMIMTARWFESANTRNDDQQTSGVSGPTHLNLPAPPTEFIIPIREDLPESTATGDQEEAEEISPATDIESLNSQFQLGSGSSILTRNGQKTLRVLRRIIQNLHLLKRLYGTEEDDATNPPSTPTPTEFIVPDEEISGEFTSIGEDEEQVGENPPPIEPELTSPTRVAIEHEDPSIPTRDEQPSNRLHINSDSKNATNWPRLFLTCLVPFVMNFFGGKHNRLAGYCFKISMALFVMASIILVIRECLRSSNSSNQNLSPDIDKSLIYVYYMLCIFAFLLLFPVFLIPEINLNPSPLPPLQSPPPHPQFHHH